MRLIALLLFAGLALAQGPPITINQTQVNGGIANDCLKVNSNKTLGQATCGGGGGGSGTVTSVATSNGITGGTITTTGTISGINAAANGTTKGVSTFTAADFDASAGVISLDYANGQKASGSLPGFLSSADWTTFNNKGSGTVTGSSLTANLPVIGAGSSAIAVGTRTGNTTQFASWTGATTASRCVHTDASGNLTIASGDCGVASGDVVGPSSATDGALAIYDGTTGKLIKNSQVTVDTTAGRAGGINMPQGTAATPAANSVLRQSPASVGTAYSVLEAAAVGVTGVVKVAVASTTATYTNGLIVASEITSATITGAQIASSIALAGSPTTTTQSAGDNSTKIATTAYADALKCTTTITTGTSGSLSTCFTVNQEATAGTGVTYTLPTAASGLQYCIDSGWNGSAANTGILTLATSASGQFLVFTDGTLSATGGNVTSGGAARDGACVYGIDSTHWMFLPHAGVWTKH